MDAAATLQHLRDRAAIADVVNKYFVGHDRRDHEMVLSCFHPDVKMSIDGQEIAKSRDELRRRFESGPPRLPGSSDAVIAATTHVAGQTLVVIEGDTADAETYATAYLVAEEQGERRLLVRGLRYIDRFARTDGRWCIVERQHTVDWMFEVDAAFASAHAERRAFTSINRQ